MTTEKPAATLETVTTPCLVVDHKRMLANLARMKQRMAQASVSLRPHLKTAKSFEAAALALPTPHGPATVSTLREAEEFGQHGVSDLLYAVCISPQKFDRVTALRRKGVDLKVIVDSVEAAELLAAHAKLTGESIPALIEIDVDGHRSGIPRGQEELLIQVGKALHAGGTRLRGVMAHAGDSYNLADPDSLGRAAEQERGTTVHMAEVLRAAGLPCPVVSIGSTPTALSARSLEGVTEVRAGVYMFLDLFQAGVGICEIDDIALSVLATVIGHKAEKNWIIVDAGWMAMSADRGTSRQAVDQFAGLVCDVNGTPYPDLVLLHTNQEHGIIAPRPGSAGALPTLKIGDRVRVLPNHACATGAQHDRYHLVDAKNRITAIWPRFRGW